jgi:hypothetical protein
LAEGLKFRVESVSFFIEKFVEAAKKEMPVSSKASIRSLFNSGVMIKELIKRLLTGIAILFLLCIVLLFIQFAIQHQ